MTYEEALRELHQVPLAQFVAERKRLAGELKASDAKGAKQLVERKRPTMSAWVVNQLYWHARDGFDQMLATAEQLRKGHLKASADHRDAIAKLRRRAATLLEDAGHAPTEATLRRVTATLSALAANGGFDSEPPGTLAADLDPPGFEAAGIPNLADDDDEKPPRAAPDGKHELAQARAHHEQTEAEQRRAEMAEKRREEEQRKRKAAERHRLEAALRTARGDVDTAERKVKQLEKELAAAQEGVANARAAVDDIAAKVAELDQ